MTTYTWTDDAMRSGTTCDVDKVADNLMHLKYNAGGLFLVNDLGTKTTSFTLEPNKINMVNITASLTVSLPTTGFISGVENKCILDCSLRPNCVLTVPSGTSIIWNGTAPTSFFVTTQGNENAARNVLTFTTRDCGTTWKAEYKTYGGVETTWIQPTLFTNGTLGGDSFAVHCSNIYDINYAWKAFDNQGAGTAWGATLGSPYIIYNPIPIKISSLDIINSDWVTNGRIHNYTLYGSNDNSVYTTLTSGTNSNDITGSTWSIIIPVANRGFYNYYKFVPSTGNGPYESVYQINIYATYIER